MEVAAEIEIEYSLYSRKNRFVLFGAFYSFLKGTK